MGKAALVVMAAGMASRYGGNKQIDGVGPQGQILLEYSVTDAIRAGFTKIVFVIKPEMEPVMERLCGKRFAQEAEVCYAYQDFSSVPAQVPAARVKPFGTVHAVLCTRDCVQEPFAVINADDYYGVEPYRQMKAFLESVRENSAAMMGYQLKNTVSRFGTVTRGICRTQAGCLTGVDEVAKIQLMDDGRVMDMQDPASPKPLDGESLVSMNFWGFHPSVFREMDAGFRKFLAGISEDDLKAEYLLPVFVDEQIRANALSVQVLPTDAAWFGMTYREDRERVSEALQALHRAGIYTSLE